MQIPDKYSQPTSNKLSSYVKSSAHFLKTIQVISIHYNKIASLDTVNLFTKAHTDETLSRIYYKWSLLGET